MVPNYDKLSSLSATTLLQRILPTLKLFREYKDRTQTLLSYHISSTEEVSVIYSNVCSEPCENRTVFCVC